MTRIVTTAYRPKRPRKRKAVALAGPAIVRKGHAKPAVPPPPTPASDDRQPLPPSAAHTPAIVTTTSRKRAQRHAERAAEPDDPEADAAMRA